MSGRNVRFIIVTIGLLGLGVSAWFYQQNRRQEQLERDVRSAFLNSNWKLGKRLCQKWLERQPGATDALLRLAEAHAELQEWDQAVDALGKVPAGDPRRTAALIEKSEIEWGNLNRPVEGLETATTVTELEPRAIEAHARVIAFFAMTFQRAKMLDAIRNAIESQGEPREAYLYLVLADEPVFVNAIELNGRWLSSDPESEQFRIGLAIQMALHVFLDAVAEAKDEAYEKEKEALQRLNEFADEFPENIELLSVLLEHAIEQGDVRRVGELLNRIPNREIRDHIVWTAKGWFHTNRQELDQAEAAFSKALQLHPSSIRAAHEYAALLRQKGQIAEAERFQNQSRIGQELRKKLLKLQSARDASGSTMIEIRDYLQLCGESIPAESLTRRLEGFSQEPAL